MKVGDIVRYTSFPYPTDVFMCVRVEQTGDVFNPIYYHLEQLDNIFSKKVTESDLKDYKLIAHDENSPIIKEYSTIDKEEEIYEEEI